MRVKRRLLGLVVGVLAACSTLPKEVPLLGTHWELVAVNGEAYVAPFAGAQPTLRLSRQGTMHVWAGCNALYGPYQRQAPDLLRIGPFDGYGRDCGHAAYLHERQIVRAIEGASHYQLQKGELRLLSPIGVEQARFRPAPPQP